MDYKPPLADMQFIWHDVLDAPAQLRALPAFGDVDAPLMQQVMAGAGKFVADQLAPLNRTGDEVGCRFDAGAVTTPPGFRAAYQAFWRAGWPAMACSAEDGGQGLPALLDGMLHEMLNAANHGWTMAPALLHGAYECLKQHGSEALKERYLPKLSSGEWLASMCLTEAHAGSDLGLVRTAADAQPDGSYRLSGEKIFISGGEHDLSDNIVHLVLARIPGAPPGSKGLSLFLCPKFLENGTRNTVHCERIEAKMGLHGSATCVLRFEAAAGWLIGAPNRGLPAMFVLMNAARLLVGLQGLGLLEAAWQKADAYANERRQSRAPGDDDASAATPSLLARHPAVRRLLDVQRAWIDAGRVLAYQTGIELDLAKHHPDPARRERAQRWCAVVTPVLKAALSRQAFEGASDCLQVLGGHGYLRDFGIEQLVRDARVAMIYEGSNEIQALDLLLRKVLPDGGAALSALLLGLRKELDASRTFDADVLRQLAELRYATTTLVHAAKLDAALPYRVADDYLRALALALLAWGWARIEHAPQAADIRWRRPADAFRDAVLPEFEMRLKMVRRQVDRASKAAAAA